jgi:anthranilate/para-aminobenzoate synthase component I
VIRVTASHRSASGAQAEAALAALGDSQGIYFGVDGGIAGLHPQQATLVDRSALALRLFGDGVAVEAGSGFGRVLLKQPALAAWAAGPLRGAGVSTLALVRRFMSSFEPSPDLLLVGALPFAAHRLRAAAGAEALGVLFLPEHFFRRDAAGDWEAVTLSIDASAGTEAAAAPRIKRTAAAAVGEPRDDLPPGGYAAMVERAVDLLKQGPLVSLTLSQAYRRRVVMPPIEAFMRLREANPAPATFFLNDGTGECLLGASPDLQLVIEGGTVTALPVCGTVARGAGAVGEAHSLRELINEDVDAASLAVCTDALRNDLAPLCEPGSLQLKDRRRPMSLATVIHAVDRLAGRLRPGCDAWDAIAATAAPVMVTGTPRSDALAAIDQLEASARGWYGGMVVQVTGTGDALVGTILRAAAVRDGIAHVRTGGDLLADSSPAREEQESRLKTRSLWRAFGLEGGGAGPVSAPGVASADLHLAVPANVTLLIEGDPFAAALADCLADLGVGSSGGAVSVLAATRRDAPRERCVAIGDAALSLLEREGFRVRDITPQQGYLLRCLPTADAPIAPDGFIAARYLRRDLADVDVPAGWTVWARGEDGSPQVLVQPERRIACILFRPDSLLSQPAADELLAAALAWCAA